MTWTCCEVHICMLPKVADAELQAVAALKFMGMRGVQKFVAQIPTVSRHAVRFARRVGFVECGRIRGACTKGGKMVDLLVMEAPSA